MSQDLETILRKSLDDVDRSQKWQMAGLAIFLLFLVLHAFAFITAVHAGTETSVPNARALTMGIISVMFMVGVCTFGITLFISRMTKRVLKAIELSSKP
jgi:nitrate reductase gamma subunit